MNAKLDEEIQKNNEELEKEQRKFEECVLESLRLTTLNAKTEQNYVDKKNDTVNKTKEVQLLNF